MSSVAIDPSAAVGACERRDDVRRGCEVDGLEHLARVAHEERRFVVLGRVVAPQSDSAWVGEARAAAGVRPAGCAVGGLALEVAGQPAVRFELYRLQCSRLHTLASFRVSRALYFFTSSFLNSS